MSDQQPEPEVGVDIVDSEVVAQSMVGKTILRGGCPYRITRYVPVAQLQWQLRGHGLPVHPTPDQPRHEATPGSSTPLP